MVEKEKARVVFESEARKIVEKPSVSIAEHVAGNAFKVLLHRFLFHFWDSTLNLC